MTPTYKIGVLGTGHAPSGGHTPPPQITPSPDFQAVLYEAKHGFFPGTHLGRELTRLETIEAGLRAAEDGCNALFINTIGDYAIEELRSAVNIPVVGAADAGLAIASQLGLTIGIVTIWPSSLEFIYRERLRTTGQEARVKSLRYVLEDAEMENLGSGEGDPVEQMRSGKAQILERIIASANGAISKDGCDVILLGCTCMAPAYDRIAEKLAVPVVDGLRAGYAMAETLVRLNLTSSRRAYPKASKDSIEAAKNLVHGSMIDALEEDCEVCIVAGDEDV
jgi:allantoin racemase